jgi:hypothetical protein
MPESSKRTHLFSFEAQTNSEFLVINKLWKAEKCPEQAAAYDPNQQNTIL